MLDISIAEGSPMPSMARPRIRRPMLFFARVRRHVQQLKPYPSLPLLMVPVTLVEPLKIVAVLVAGGHWLSGTAMIIAAYGASLLIVERLFRSVKAKLLMLHWFATIWAIVTRIKSAAILGALLGKRTPVKSQRLPLAFDALRNGLGYSTRTGWFVGPGSRSAIVGRRRQIFATLPGRPRCAKIRPT